MLSDTSIASTTVRACDGSVTIAEAIRLQTIAQPTRIPMPMYLVRGVLR
jgi:hypothetical protein